MGKKESDIRVLNSTQCEIFVRTLKGRTTEGAVRRGPLVYTVPAAVVVDTPLSVLNIYVGLRVVNASDHIFAPKKPSSGWFNGRLKALLDSEEIISPGGCCYSSHSMRLGSLAERILLGGSVVELLALYD